MTKPELIIEWAEGRYALGWRGWLAQKILEPALYEALYSLNRKGGISTRT